MGYHPETLVFSFPPCPRYRGMKMPLSFSGLLYRLKPWVGFDVWHIDPERPGTGNRSDDSCGWFDRTPGAYADAVAYVIKDETTMHDVRLALARRKHMPMPFYEGISDPDDDPDRARGYPRLTQADTLALVLMLARELEVRRWWNGENGREGASLTFWRKRLTKRRNVDDEAFGLALSPLDNLSSVEDGESMVRLIAAALNRRFKPWWKHPRWHVHHWQIKLDLPRNLRRMFQRCPACGERLGFGYCPTRYGNDLYHGHCSPSGPNSVGRAAR